jgi:hypothetical protein
MSRQFSESEYASMVESWIKAETAAPNKQQRSDFNYFADWCRFYDLPMPAGADDVADYLLEMLMNGAPLSDIERVAASTGPTMWPTICWKC